MLLATHSPVLAALPGALIYELHGDGFTTRKWAELDLVQDWQAFFDDPRRLLSTCRRLTAGRRSSGGPPSLGSMDTVLTALHVIGAVFVVGPMAVLPMTAMRAVRAGSGPVVEVLARSTRVFSLASLVVAFLGFAVLGVVGKTDKISVTTGWVLTSIVLYVVALGLSLFVVVPAMDTAGRRSRPVAPRPVERFMADRGVVRHRVALLLVLTVLMVWRP